MNVSPLWLNVDTTQCKTEQGKDLSRFCPTAAYFTRLPNSDTMTEMSQLVKHSEHGGDPRTQVSQASLKFKLWEAPGYGTGLYVCMYMHISAKR